MERKEKWNLYPSLPAFSTTITTKKNYEPIGSNDDLVVFLIHKHIPSFYSVGFVFILI